MILRHLSVRATPWRTTCRRNITQRIPSLSELPSKTKIAKLMAAGAAGAWIALDVARAIEEVPKFDPSGSRYDSNTYWGRVANMKDLTDSMTLFTSDEELE